MFIYQCRCARAEPNNIVFQQEIKLIHSFELYYAKMTNKLKPHYIKWFPMYPDTLHTQNTGSIISDEFINDYILDM